MKIKYLFFLLATILLVSCESSSRKREQSEEIGKLKEKVRLLEKKASLEEMYNSLSDENVKAEEIVETDEESPILEVEEPQNPDPPKFEPKKWRADLPNGGYADYETCKDGSVKMTVVTPCINCHGNLICPACGGAGGQYLPASGIFWACAMCLQTGRCQSCNGKGTTTYNSIMNSSGSGYGVSSNGYVTTYGPGGAIVSSPNGTVTPYAKGGGTGSSSSSTSRDRSNDYIDKIVYAPNYTGKSESVWCDKCNAYKSPHVHIKQRY